MKNYLGEELVIENVTSDDAGLYSCVVANPLGVSHQNGWLEVDVAVQPIGELVKFLWF